MVVGNINTKDISVVVQGAIDEKYTIDCLKSIRKYLPDSEIILSTWEGSKVDNLDYDILVLSKDPGFSLSVWEEDSKPNNTNRQILSTINGLKKVNKKYSLKFRTDFILTGNNFLKYFYNFPKYEEEYKIFNNKLLACCYFSINPNKCKRAYHIGDFCFFGYTLDLINLFDIDLAKLDELYYEEYLNFKYTPEQYIFIKCLEKNGKEVKSKYFNDVNNESIIETEKYFASNFILLNINEYNIKLPDKNIVFDFNLNEINNELFKSCYTHIEWQKLYKKYADKKHKVSSYDKERKILENNYKKYIASKNNKKNNILENIFSIKKYNDKTIIIICFIKITIKTNIYKKIYKIQSKDVSVIVQGVIHKKHTVDCIKSIRKYLPDSEIILSTWEGSNVEELDYDILVINKDCGSNGLIRKYPQYHFNNIDRQIITSLNGVKKSNRKYSLKIRSDMFLTGSSFLKYYSMFSSNSITNSFFKKRIMVNGHTTLHTSYTIGDWWSFGLTEDIKEYYNISLYKIKFGNEFFFQDENYTKRPKFQDIVCQFIPEQWITMQNIKKFDNNLDIKHYYDINENDINKHINFIVNNIICLEDSLSNIHLNKYEKVNFYLKSKYFLDLFNWYNLCKNHNITLHKYPLHLKIIRDINIILGKLKLNDFSPIKQYIKMVNSYHRNSSITSKNNDNIYKQNITFIIYDESEDIHVYREYLLYIKQHFNEAKIILCLDKEINNDTLEGLYDKIVIKENNFHYEYDKKQFYIKKALELVDTKYVIKTSLECIFDKKIINLYNEYLNKFNKYDINYTIFKQKILIPQYMTVDSRVTPGFINPYSYSTIFQFGLTNDIKKIWGGYEISEKDLDQNKNIKYTEDQITIRNILEKTDVYKNIMFPQYSSDSSRDEYIFDSEKILSNNFIIAEQNQVNIKNVQQLNLIFISLYRYLEIYLLNVDPANEYLLKQLEHIYNKNNHTSISNNVFNIEYKENKKIITLFGFKITIKIRS